MGIPGTKVRNPHCMKFGGDSVQWGFRPVGIPGTYRSEPLLESSFSLDTIAFQLNECIEKDLRMSKFVVCIRL